jgi:hypothetical protein
VPLPPQAANYRQQYQQSCINCAKPPGFVCFCIVGLADVQAAAGLGWVVRCDRVCVVGNVAIPESGRVIGRMRMAV